MSLDCEICYQQFDSDSRAPRNLPCGKSICSKCLEQTLGGTRRCPFCQEAFSLGQTLQSFPKNFLSIEALQIIVKQNVERYGVCRLHNQPLKWLCFTEKTKICEECRNTSHRSHDVRCFETVVQAARVKKSKLDARNINAARFTRQTINLLNEQEVKINDEFQKGYRALQKADEKVKSFAQYYAGHKKVKTNQALQFGSEEKKNLEAEMNGLIWNDDDKLLQDIKDKSMCEKNYEAQSKESREVLRTISLVFDEFSQNVGKITQDVHKKLSALNQSQKLPPIVLNFKPIIPPPPLPPQNVNQPKLQ